MVALTQSISRYSDADLAEFKTLIEKKLVTAYEDLEYLREQISDTTENMEKDGDYMEESTSFTDLEMFHDMVYRLQKHVQSLENALVRIRNKSYGICVVTGELIDKRRLLAVPTTTMCMAAKLAGTPAPKKPESKPSASKSSTPIIITKAYGKPAEPKPQKKVPLGDLDLFEDDDDIDDDGEMNFDIPTDFVGTEDE